MNFDSEACVILYKYGFGVVEPISNAGFQYQNINKEQMTFLVVVLSEPCFLAMSSSNPFHSMAPFKPRLLSQMCYTFVQFLN